MMQVSLEVMNAASLKDKKNQKVGVDLKFKTREADESGTYTGAEEVHPISLLSTMETISQKSLLMGKRCSVKICGYL